MAAKGGVDKIKYIGRLLPGLVYGAWSGAALGMLNATWGDGDALNAAKRGALAGGAIGFLSGGLTTGLTSRDLLTGAGSSPWDIQKGN